VSNDWFLENVMLEYKLSGRREEVELHGCSDEKRPWGVEPSPGAGRESGPKGGKKEERNKNEKA